MKTAELHQADIVRVCRDLAWGDISAMPGMARRLSARCSWSGVIDWSFDGLALDSLACMQLATAAATWCNAFEVGFEDLFLAKRNAADWADAMSRVAQLGGSHLTFSTSGSTGVRKHIRHQLSVLMEEAQAWARLLTVGHLGRAPGLPVTRIVVLAPTHHIYGFIWGVLVPIALGVTAIDADLESLPELLPGDLLVAVPNQWEWLASSQRTTSGWPHSVRGVSSTAPLSANIHHQLTLQQTSQAGGIKAALAQLLHIYGSAETAGLAWRDDPSQAYTLASGRVRTAGIAIALQRQHAGLAELAVQDELDWVDDQRFHVVGRLDSCVQVGGHNVSPAWVADQLASHGAVAHAAVRLSSSAKPQRLKAFVVMKQTAEQVNEEGNKNGYESTMAHQIEVWAADNLPWYAMPGSFKYGLALPRSSMGKLCDWPD